jgi:cell division protein FtsW
MSEENNAEFHKYDYLLIIALAALLIVGLTMIYSTTFALGYQEYDQPAYFFLRQLLWMGIGLLALIITARIEYHTWRKFSVLILGGTILLLLLVFLAGNTRFGGQRWLVNGSVQPSELAKLAVIIYIADWLSSKGEQIRKLSYGLVPFGILIGVITGLILLQRDLGTAALIAATSLMMFFVAGGSLWQLAVSGVLGLITLYFLIVQSPYRSARLATFWDPFSDPLAGGYQIRQILIALGVGGVTGLGLGSSRQKFGYIPASHTDGIFAIWGEELGLLGAVALILLFTFFAYRGFRIAMAAPDAYGTVLAAGITSSIILQAIINIGVVTATVPFTGIPLPFISFGGSSLVISMSAVGLLLAVSRRTMPEETSEKEHREVDNRRRRNRRTRVSGASRRRRAKAEA